MWRNLLKYVPNLLIHAIGPVTDLIQSKSKCKESLHDIKIYCEQVEAGLLTSEQAIELIKSLVK